MLLSGGTWTPAPLEAFSLRQAVYAERLRWRSLAGLCADLRVDGAARLDLVTDGDQKS